MLRSKTLAICLPLLACCGCFFGASSEEAFTPRFSPDSRYVVVPRLDEHTAWGIPLSWTLVVAWQNIDDPNTVHDVHYDAAGAPADETAIRAQMHIEVSPDSQRIAALGPNGLFLVALDSKPAQRLNRPGERVTSVAWHGADELRYVA